MAIVNYADPTLPFVPGSYSLRAYFQNASGAFMDMVAIDPSSPSQGSTGVNTSANQPASVSAIVAAGNVLLATVAATTSRAAVVIQNQSPGTVIVVGDDGTSDTVIWTWLLTGVGSDQQGAEIPPELGKFKGRFRVYGASGARVAVVGI